MRVVLDDRHRGSTASIGAQLLRQSGEGLRCFCAASRERRLRQSQPRRVACAPHLVPVAGFAAVRSASLRISGLPAAGYAVRHRRLDTAHSNLGAAWERLGGDAWPTEQEWRALRAGDCLEDLEPEHSVRVSDGSLELQLDLPMPSISLLELTPESPTSGYAPSPTSKMTISRGRR